GLGEHAAAEQDGDLGGVALVVLGLAAVEGLPVQSVSEDKRDLLFLAEVGEPVPGEQALAGDDETFAEGGDGAEEGVGAGGDGLLQDGGAGGIEDADGEGPGVEVNAPIESMLLVVESHHGLRGRGRLAAGNTSVPVAKRP